MTGAAHHPRTAVETQRGRVVWPVEALRSILTVGPEGEFDDLLVGV
jgi:hypothetical protein